MSKKNGRKLFSKSDNTTFLNDLHEISEETKAWFHGMPDHLKKWMYEATEIVDIIQKIDDALQDGQPADTVIEFVLNGHPELQAIYERVKTFIEDAAASLNEISMGLTKFQFASAAIGHISKLSEVESDTITQNAVYFYKHG